MASISFATIRKAARHVAENAPHVHVIAQRATELAREFDPAAARRLGPDLPEGLRSEDRLAYLVTLAALRFGTGYEPRLRKRPGLSAQHTLEACLGERFRAQGPLAAGEMARATAEDVAAFLGQDLQEPPQAEFVDLQARALRDLGRFLLERFEGSFVALVESAGASAARLAESLATMPYFHDQQRYRGLDVPFFHRAQRLALDLHAVFGDDGLGRFEDLSELALSSDTVPAHELRMEGVIAYDEGLTGRVDRGELVPAHSEREVEIRAAAVHAVDRIAAAVVARGGAATSLDVDAWLRGAAGAPRQATSPDAHRLLLSAPVRRATARS
jgi:hypothetical protein